MEGSSNGDVKLKLNNLHLSFGGVKALDAMSIEIKEGQIFSIIGPNGAGKTCALNCVNGFYRAQQGEIYFEGQNITKLKPYTIAQLGISRTFQNIQLYTGLTVVDNLMAARHFLFKSTWLEGALYFGKSHKEEVRHRRVVEEIVDFLELERWRKQVVTMLPCSTVKETPLSTRITSIYLTSTLFNCNSGMIDYLSLDIGVASSPR